MTKGSSRAWTGNWHQAASSSICPYPISLKYLLKYDIAFFLQAFCKNRFQAVPTGQTNQPCFAFMSPLYKNMILKSEGEDRAKRVGD